MFKNVFKACDLISWHLAILSDGGNMGKVGVKVVVVIYSLIFPGCRSI